MYSVREDAKANTFSAVESEVANYIQSTQPATTSHHAINYVVQAYPINTMALGGRPDPVNDRRMTFGVGNDGEPQYTLQANHSHAVAHGMAVRRLTPTECERLQGFPDGWTDIKHYKCCGISFDAGCGAYGCPNCNGSKVAKLALTPDSPRYKAIGNSMAVPVMRWIGQRIQGHNRYDI
jgi:site-specific DNA-cytosine methylase